MEKKVTTAEKGRKKNSKVPADAISKADQYGGSGNPESTLDANAPIEGRRVQYVTPKLFLRSVDRSPKDLLTLQQALVAAESVYYPNQTRLFDIYSEALRDGHLQGILKKRIAQVVNKKLIFKRNGEEVPEMTKLIRSRAFRKVIKELMLRKMWGLRGMEFIPGKKLAFNEIDPKHIKLKTQKVTFEQFGLDDGISYTDIKNWWILGDHHDFGLLLYLSYYVMLKRGAVGDWASYIEMFGSPVMIMKYKGYDTQAQKAAERILNTAGNSMKMALPEEMGFDMKDGKMSNGDGKLQETFRLAMNQEMSLIMLGNTETSASGQHGSEGKSKTHSLEQKEIMKEDMDDMVDDLNSDHFIDILSSYNYPVEGGAFEYDKEVDIDYLKDYVPVVTQAITQWGLPISKKWAYDLLGIPAPETEADTIQLFPVLGQEPNPEPDEEDGKPNPANKPKTKQKPKTPKALSLSDVSAMMDEKLTAFFGPAR